MDKLPQEHNVPPPPEVLSLPCHSTNVYHNYLKRLNLNPTHPFCKVSEMEREDWKGTFQDTMSWTDPGAMGRSQLASKCTSAAEWERGPSNQVIALLPLAQQLLQPAG